MHWIEWCKRPKSHNQQVGEIDRDTNAIYLLGPISIGHNFISRSGSLYTKIFHNQTVQQKCGDTQMWRFYTSELDQKIENPEKNIIKVIQLDEILSTEMENSIFRLGTLVQEIEITDCRRKTHDGKILLQARE